MSRFANESGGRWGNRRDRRQATHRFAPSLAGQPGPGGPETSRLCRLVVVGRGFDRWLSESREKRQCLPVQPRPSDDGAEVFAGREIEADDLVLGDAMEMSIEMSIRTEAQTARLAEFN